MTTQLNIALIRKLRVILMCFAYFFEMIFMGVCTTMQASARLVQKLNVCTVFAKCFHVPVGEIQGFHLHMTNSCTL